MERATCLATDPPSLVSVALLGREHLEVLVQVRGSGLFAGPLGRRTDAIPAAGHPQPVQHECPVEQVVLPQRGDRLVKAEHDAHGSVAELGALRIEIVAEDLPGCVGDPEHGCVLGELEDEEGVLTGAGHRVLLLSVRCPCSYTRMRDVRVLEVSPPGGSATRRSPYPLPCRLRI